METPTQPVDLLLATKFFIPVASQPLVARTMLTLVCAPAGFGKSTLLAEWVRSHPTPPDGPFVAWVSLDEDDDITALSRAFPGVGSQALEYLHTPEGPHNPYGGRWKLFGKLKAFFQQRSAPGDSWSASYLLRLHRWLLPYR